MRNAECGVWSVVFGVRSVEFGVRNAESGVLDRLFSVYLRPQKAFLCVLCGLCGKKGFKTWNWAIV